MSFTLKDIDHGWKALRKFAKQQQSYAKAGVFGEGPKAKERHEGDPLTNVDLAVIHEFGAPAANIPERSFIRSSFELHHADYLLLLRRMLEKMIKDRKFTILQALNLLGARMANDMKNLITTEGGHPVALAPETVRRKGSNVPLVDTGQLVNSITWVVVDGAASAEADHEGGGHHE